MSKKIVKKKKNKTVKKKSIDKALNQLFHGRNLWDTR